MADSTESIRKEMVAEINAQPGSREYLEAKHGQVWDTGQLSDDFDVIGFMAPVVVVRLARATARREASSSSTARGFTTASSRTRSDTSEGGVGNNAPLFYKDDQWQSHF